MPAVERETLGAFATPNGAGGPPSEAGVPGRILIIDDEAPIREALARVLHRLGFETSDASTAETGLEAIGTGDHDVVLLDLRMPGSDGHVVLRGMRALEGRLRLPSVVVMSGHGNMDDVIDVMRGGAVDYLRKPWNLTELMSAVTRGLERRPKPDPSLLDAPIGGDAAGPARDPKRAARFADVPDRMRRGEIPIPATPAVLIRLRELLADPLSSIEEIAAAVERDPRIAADIIRVANAASYSRLGRATNVKTAVSRLGLRHVHNLAQTLFLEGFCDVPEGPYKKLLAIVWRRSVARAVAMRALCDVLDPAHTMNADTAYMIGLMSDIGASLLLWIASERSPANLTADDVRDTGAVLEVVRRSHAELAGALLDSWKYDKVIAGSCAQHHMGTPPAAHALWWSVTVLGDDIASRLVGEEDPTVTQPRDRMIVERCAAELSLPVVLLERLVGQLRAEFATILTRTS